MRDGLIADPPDALREGGADISVEYTSTIHAEMKAALKMRAINTLLEMAAMLAQIKPETTDKVDVDRIVDEVSKVYPGAAAFIRSDKDVAALRGTVSFGRLLPFAGNTYSLTLLGGADGVRYCGRARPRRRSPG